MFLFDLSTIFVDAHDMAEAMPLVKTAGSCIYIRPVCHQVVKWYLIYHIQINLNSFSIYYGQFLTVSISDN